MSRTADQVTETGGSVNNSSRDGMIADRPSGGDFFETEKGWGAARILVPVALAIAVSGCAASVRPSAERIFDRVQTQEGAAVDAYLARRGFEPRMFHGTHPYIDSHTCVEKANGW